MFTDKVHLHLIAGKGGDGCVAWRKEKYIPKGGPAGGNGGHGASIYLEASSQIFSLEDFRNIRRIQAENGQPGGARQKNGRKGKDKILKVPLGTVVKNLKSQEILFDFTEDKQIWKVCSGAKGGIGNRAFRTSTNQSPNYATKGKVGEEKEIELELKIIADVGLIGMPNAGKSTLISKLAFLSVKTAPYPFTTLRPNIGMVEFEDFSRIFIADIPGIIDQAHNNKGLGLCFLRHIERTKQLIYIIDISATDRPDPFEDFQILQKEIQAYNPEILQKPFFVVLNKMDTEQSSIKASQFKERYPFSQDTLIEISALKQTNLKVLKEKLYKTHQSLSKNASLVS